MKAFLFVFLMMSLSVQATAEEASGSAGQREIAAQPRSPARSCHNLTYGISANFGFGNPENPSPTVRSSRAREERGFVLFAMARGQSTAPAQVLLEEYETPEGLTVPAISAPRGSHLIEVSKFRASANISGIPRGASVVHIDLIDGQTGVRREIYIDARDSKKCRLLYVQKSYGDPLDLDYEQFKTSPSETFDEKSQVCVNRPRASARAKGAGARRVVKTPDQILCDYF